MTQSVLEVNNSDDNSVSDQEISVPLGFKLVMPAPPRAKVISQVTEP